MTQSGPAKERHPIRRRFVLKRLGKKSMFWVRLGVALILLLIAGLLFVTKSGYAGGVFLPSIGEQIGAEIEAGAVRVRNSGEVVLEDVRILAPGVEGPGALIASVRKVTADVDWGRTLTGDLTISAIELEAPEIRVSENTETGIANVAGLKLPEGDGGIDSTVTLPRITVTGGSIQLAEHNDRSVRVLKRINIDGELRPEGEDAYLIDLKQTGAEDGLELTGTIDRLGVQVSLSGLTLDDWGPESVPGRLRPFVEQLNVEGEISNTIFSVSPSGVVTASVHLSDVGITLPIEMNEASGAGRIRMTGVTGAISLRDDQFSADISGLLEDVPYEVSLIYEGLSPDAPFHGNFRVSGYRMAENPDIVPFLPEKVGYRLKQFAGTSLAVADGDIPISPSAIVDASVTLTRGEPGPDGPAEVDYRGSLSFRNGSAAYEVFPYPFQNLTGSVQFDQNRIRIEEIRGVSETGAVVSATGLIEPLGNGAGVNLQIDTVGVPIDDTLERALGEGRGKIVDELFDDGHYQQLVERELLLTPEGARRLRDRRDALRVEIARAEEMGETATGAEREIAAIERRLRSPIFEYRGEADLGIRLRRKPGPEGIWTRDIEVRLTEAGLVMKDFPYPILARDVVVVLNKQEASLMRGSFRPLSGGTLSLTGGADLRTPEGEMTFRPSVRIVADRLPIDERLLFAIAPGAMSGSGADGDRGDEGRAAALEVLRALGAGGRLDADGMLLTRTDGDIGFDIELDLQDVTLTPEALGDRAPVIIGNPEGTVRLTEQGMTVFAHANAIGVTGDASIEDPVEVRVSADLDWSGDEDLRYSAHLEADGVYLDIPFEQAVASVSEAGGETLVYLRETFRPSGRADVRAVLTSDGRNALSDVRIFNVVRAEADYLGGRLGLTDTSGAARVVIDDDRTLRVDGLSGTITFDGEAMGAAQIAGTLGLDPDAGPPGRALVIDFEDMRFEGTLARRVVRDVVQGMVAKEYLEHEATGAFDGRIRMTAPRPVPGEPNPEGVARLAFVETTIEPRWAEFTREGATVRFDDVKGRIIASRRGARLQDIVATSGTMRAEVDGATTPDGSGGMASTVRFDFLSEEGLTPEVRALTPIILLEILDASEVDVVGALAVRNGIMRTRTVVDQEEVDIAFDGRVEFEDAAITAALRIDQATGEADIEFLKEIGELPAYAIDVRTKHARALGLSMTDGSVAIQSTGEPRGMVVPRIYATSAGGAISGKAGIYPAMHWAGPEDRAYEATLAFSGMKLNETLDGFASARPDAPEREPRPDTGARLEGMITVGGLVGKEHTRRGTLDAQIAGGDVIDLPGAIRLVEAGNFQLPVSERVDYANIEAVFDGPLISIEGFSLYSKSVELLGYGTATWPDLELDLRMRSKAARRIPVLSTLIETIRDEFVTIVVSGTAANPAVRVQSLPETRRVIGRVLGFEETSGERRLNDIADRASRERRRAR